MLRARVCTIAVAIALFLTLPATARAQNAPGMPTGNVLTGQPQDDMASAPGIARLGSLIILDTFAARQWILELAAAQQARLAKRADVKSRRLAVKRTPTWAP